MKEIGVLTSHLETSMIKTWGQRFGSHEKGMSAYRRLSDDRVAWSADERDTGK